MPSILVVDDEKSIREALSFLLQEQGHHIDQAENGLEALSLLQAKHYDVVLSDVRMPRLNGIQLLEIIRGQWGGEIPVILLSAYINQELTPLAQKAGAYAVISKPFSTQTIMQQVSRALETPSPQKGAQVKPFLLEVDNEIQKKILEFSALEMIQKSMRPIGDNAKLLAEVMQHTQSLFDLDAVILCLYDRDGNLQHGCRRLSQGGALQEADCELLEKRLLPSIARSQRSLLIERLDTHPGFQRHYPLPPGSMMILPLLTDYGLQGAMLLYADQQRAGLTAETSKTIAILLNYLGLKMENNERGQRLHTYYTDTVQALFAALGAKDAYTYEHSAKVACYALIIARGLQLSEYEFRNLEYLALLHDIGKVALPDELLHKKNGLSEEEVKMWQTHPLAGAGIIASIKFIPGACEVIRHHHEQYDGSGYPDGLKGREIPLYARIIAIADGFANLTETLALHNREAQKQMIDVMMRDSGRKYDPEMLKIFIQSYCRIILLDRKNTPLTAN
ncbi:response regulator [candidate division FCPU426 bacterium]|nr:response regulator [candidate division FCPU426 bacterium]